MVVARAPHKLEPCPRAVSIGTFDGVHVGHPVLISQLANADLRSAVVTFDPHPRSVGGDGVELISSLERRVELLEAAGAHDVLVLAFDRAHAALSAEAWVRAVLKPIGTRSVNIGEGFRFGHRRRGDADTLRRLGLKVTPTPLLFGASSSRIRELVRAGDLPEVTRSLGRPLEVVGTVQTGGWTLRLDEGRVVLPSGLYAALALGRQLRVGIRADGVLELGPLAKSPVGPGARLRVQLHRRVTVRDSTRDVGRREYPPGSPRALAGAAAP